MSPPKANKSVLSAWIEYFDIIYNGKNITSPGDGALVSNDEDLLAKSKFLATQARDQAAHYQNSEVGMGGDSLKRWTSVLHKIKMGR